ncbi:hypothetical protein [Geoalkalibacter sp.]|uniref:hypothetical protein n=1 Tax=Geoalkalibacter sp. TaxID=3041440 RepID=UPI00272EAD33|nr:hypothetical protein [Geoalkalibacter sp.]
MGFVRDCFFCGLVLWFGLLSGCGPTVSRIEVLQAPADGPRWPAPPEPARIRYVTAFSGVKDVAPEPSRAQRTFRLVTGQKQEEVPLVNPFAVAADGEGGVWVTDTGAAVVHFFDLAARRVSHFSRVGDLTLVTPAGIAFDAGRDQLFLADADLGRVFRLDRSGRLLGELRPPQGFARPGGVAVDAGGRVFVTDVQNGIVQIFAPDGSHLRALGSARNADRRFNRPIAVAIGGQGQVAVLDAMNFRVELFSPDLRSLGVVGGLGDGPGRFARPRGLAFDSHQHLYVADAAFDNVQIFDNQGELLLYFGGPGSQPGRLCLPAGLFIDGQDRIYAVDVCNFRVQVFEYLQGKE